MNKTILLIALMLMPLSGCLGIPEGAIGPGDTVRAVVTVEDAETGEVLMQGQSVDFAVGSGASGLGFQFERSLIGLDDAFVGTIDVRDDPSLQWSGKVDAQARFESDLVQAIPRGQFVQNFGEPVAGETFEPQFSFFPYLIVSEDATSVQFRPLPEQGQRDPVPNVGAILVTTVEGDTLVQTLEPDVGATFRVLPPTQFNPETPLGLAPGSYRTVGGDGEVIVFEHSSSSNPELVGRDLDIQVAVQSVQQADRSGLNGPVDGNYGVRQSPYINGVPSRTVDFTADDTTSGPNDDGHGHDDGHGDHDH